MVKGQEMVSIDDLVSLLQVAARDDTTAGGITLSYKGRTVVVSQDQAMASVGGRLVPLPSPAVRVGRRWLVPIDVLPRALTQIYDARIELRRTSQLLIVGDLRVPRVTVRLDSAGPPTRLSIEASPSTRITPSVESGRVVLRLDADALDVAPLPQAGGLLEQARTEGHSVVLMLSPRAGQARASQAAGDNLSRINVDVPAAGQAGAPTRPATVPSAPTEPTSTPTSAPGARVVVLDPGHGGADAGAIGQGGTQEKTLTLDIARRAKLVLESRLGLRVLLTRDEDKSITLDERTTFANTNKADLFVSLHLNASLSPRASGAEVYQLKLPPEESAGARGSTDEPLTLPVTTGGTRTLSLVPWHLAQTRHHDASTLLANLLESALRAQVPMGTRPTQEAPMRVLAGLDMAAVLVELAYVSNPEQEAAVQADDFQTRAVQAILEAVTAYRAAWRGGR
jgi:N-acetylmuramoyl-L-alanine amidase